MYGQGIGRGGSSFGGGRLPQSSMSPQAAAAQRMAAREAETAQKRSEQGANMQAGGSMLGTLLGAIVGGLSTGGAGVLPGAAIGASLGGAGGKAGQMIVDPHSRNVHNAASLTQDAVNAGAGFERYQEKMQKRKRPAVGGSYR